MIGSAEPPPDARPAHSSTEKRALGVLNVVERTVFFVIGVLLFVAALALLWRSALLVATMFAAHADIIAQGTAFLDLILLVLMVVELAYTVMLSLRGEVLVAEPFLIVALIAVIRRILVITVGEVQKGAAPSAAASRDALAELGVLTAVVLVFVLSIVLLRPRSGPDKEPLSP